MKRFVVVAAAALALVILTSCSPTTRGQGAGSRESPTSLSDCAVNTIRRPPILAAVVSGPQGVAVAGGARLALCAVQVERGRGEDE